MENCQYCFRRKRNKLLRSMLKMYKNTKTQQWLILKSFIIATEIEIVALPFHRAVCIGCTVVKSHFKMLGWNLPRKLTQMYKHISNQLRQFEIAASKLSIKVPMFRVLYFRWRQWNTMFPMETSFATLKLDSSRVLTVNLGCETSLAAYSTDKCSIFN